MRVLAVTQADHVAGRRHDRRRRFVKVALDVRLAAQAYACGVAAESRTVTIPIGLPPPSDGDDADRLRLRLRLGTRPSVPLVDGLGGEHRGDVGFCASLITGCRLYLGEPQYCSYLAIVNGGLG